MTKFSGTRPGMPDDLGVPSVEDVPVIEGANLQTPSEQLAQLSNQASEAQGGFTYDLPWESPPQMEEGYTAPVIQQEKPTPTISELDNQIQAEMNRVAPQRQPSQEELNAAQNMQLVDSSGNPIEKFEDRLNVVMQEADDSVMYATRPGVVDMTRYNELAANFNNIVHESDLGTIQDVAKDATLYMNQVGVLKNTEQTTGLNTLSSMFEVEDKAAIGGFVNAASAIAMEVMSGRINPDVQSAIEEDTVLSSVENTDDPFAHLLGENLYKEPTNSSIEIGSGMKADSFNNRLAGAYKKYMKNLKVSQGETTENTDRANGSLIGPMLSSVALESGLFKEVKGNDNNTYIIPTKKGVEFARASKYLAEETIGERKGLRRPKTPANQNTGWYNSWNTALATRNQLIPRYKGKSLEMEYKSPNKKRGKLSDLSDFAVKVGSVPYTTTATQVGGLALLTTLASNPNMSDSVKKFLGLDNGRFNTIASEAGGGARGQRAAQQEFKKTVNKVNNSMNDYSGIATTAPEFNPHKMDPTPARHYPENLAVEVQNNLINRSLANNAVANHMKVSKNDINSIAQMGTESKKYFLKHFKDGGQIKDKRMAIISNLVAAHKSILGKASESMTWEERVAQLTPDFIVKQATIGKSLKSAIAKLGLLTPEGSIDTASVKRFNLELDVNTGNLAPKQIPELTPEESEAIQTWLSNSDKKTFGFVLSAYTGLADLATAVTNDTYWNPKITADMDMNSAGRTYLAMDIGDNKVLSRTGILFDVNDRIKGSPRQFFYTQIDRIIDTRYNAYRLNKLFPKSKANLDSERIAISNIVKRNFTKFREQYADKFYDALGKSVLLTDDYGKHWAFHGDAAQKFLFDEDFSSLKQELTPYYNSDTDMVADFADLYAKAILDNTDMWNKQLPKDIVEYLQFFGRFPEPTLYFGEKASIGSESYREVDDDSQATFLTLPDGKQVKVPKKQLVLDPTKKAKEKRVYDAATNTHMHFIPEYNTFNVNMIGPLLGQYRESATLIDAVNMVNPDKTKTPHWFAIVHDNLVVDGNGFAPYFFAVNSVKEGSAKKILDFDIMGEFIQDFRRQQKDIINEFRKEVGEKGGIDNVILDIGTAGKYAAIGRRADTVYNRLKSMEEDKRTNQALEEELKLYEGIGWRSPDQRDGDLKSYPIRLSNLLKKQFQPKRRSIVDGKEQQLKGEYMDFFKAYGYLKNIIPKADQFITSDGKYLKETAASLRLKRLDHIQKYQDMFYFFT